MNTNISHLKYIVEVAKLSSITKASRILYIGQPNLSKIIQNIENEVGFHIFKRTPKGVEPTLKGGMFISYCQSILENMDKIDNLSTSKADGSKKLNICVPRSDNLIGICTEFMNGLDNKGRCEIKYKECSSNEAVDLVSDGKMDLGVIRYNQNYDPSLDSDFDRNGIAIEPLGKYIYYILMSNKNPLAQMSLVPFHVLTEQTQIMYPQSQILYADSVIESAYEENFYNQKQLFIYDRAAIFEFLDKLDNSYTWSAPVNGEILKRYGLVEKKCTVTAMVHTTALIYKTNRRLGLFEKKFIDMLKDHYTEMKL